MDSEKILTIQNSIDVGRRLIVKDPKQQQNDPAVSTQETLNSNPYEYIHRKDYTTEIFKIEVENLPRNTTHPAFINFLRKKRIKYRKVKVIPSSFKSNFGSDLSSHAYITLKCNQERLEAIKTLNGCLFRGKILSCKESDPLPDPLIVKRLKQPGMDMDSNYDQLSDTERYKIINDQVCSLWDHQYSEQIAIKLDCLKLVLKKCFNELKSLNQNNLDSSESIVKLSLNWFRTVGLKQLEQNLIPSPQIYGYRNKYEFNVGPDRQCGFRLGLYRQGSIRVVNPPPNCPIISSHAHLIWKHFQRYLLDGSTSLDGYNPVTHRGYWRQILVRLNRRGESLISIMLTRQPELTDQALEQECQKICEHFSNNKTIEIKSIYIDIIESSTQAHRSNSHPRHLDGETHIFEKLKIFSPVEEHDQKDHLEFRISPTSFFQINVDAAELLYSKIIELSRCTPQTILLDICCGTGTIGLCLAKRVKRVIGFEINHEAIEDARFNAQHNKIENVEFHCGRAEKLISPILDRISGNSGNEEFVAILDPPRNGLPASIIKSLRNNIKIKRIIYVACEAMAAKQNFIDLCRPRSNAYNKSPFVPLEAVPVDMFPHTNRCELILIFERGPL